MTPEQQKARELVEKFEGYAYCNAQGSQKEDAKQCALIACDIAIGTAMNGYLLSTQEVANFQIKQRDYWQSVKKSINELT